jgi:hypothetical protein
MDKIPTSIRMVDGKSSIKSMHGPFEVCVCVRGRGPLNLIEPNENKISSPKPLP